MQAATNFITKNQALKYPLFRNYLLTRFFIILALNMQSFIIYYWVYTLTKDVSLVGVLGLCEAIPAIGCSFFSGHFVDKMEKRGTILTCIIGYVLVGLFLATLSVPRFEQTFSVGAVVRMVYFAVFLGGVLRAFMSPASFAIMGMLLPRTEYANGTTWSSTAWQVGAVLGPLVGGFILVAGTDISMFSVIAFELVALVAIIRIPKQPILQNKKEPILKSLREGLRFVFSTQVILAALSLDMFAVLFGGAVALLPAYAQEILHVGAIGLGWLRAAPGIGSMITLGILSFIPLKKKPGYKLLVCIAGFGLATVAFAVSKNFYLSFFLLILTGVFDMVSVVIRGTILQLYTPETVRGRVAAVNTMFVSSSNELGAVESGYTAKWMGLIPSVVFGGCMTIVVVISAFFAAPKLRTLSIHVAEDDAEAKAVS